ncbi:MAG: hypothetical protein LBK73_14180 [Treponema sp.]|jgi:hypothetical protein|nr:hypothetical protein [Treponema sp.]
MKKRVFFTGMAAILLTFGLVLTGCGDDGGGDGNVGENELSGKTYFMYSQKIEFAESGTYKKSTPTTDEDGDYVYDGNGKYTYTEIENGSYSWDDSSKKVVFKPAKIAILLEDYSGYGALLDRTGYRSAFQEEIDKFKAKNGQAALDQELAGMGFSSMSAYIDYRVNEAFANTIFAYIFAAEGAALLMSEELPSNNGANELDGQTFNGSASTYVFSGAGYTYTDSHSNSATGTYAWNAQIKLVYLKPAEIDGKTNVQYFESMSGDYTGYYNTADDYRASLTNGRFIVQQYPYDLTEKTVGWDN